MLKSKFLGAAALLALSATLFTPLCAVAAMSVRPVVVDLKTSGSGMNQVVTVENTSVNALPVELSVQAVTFDADGAHPSGKDPGDLVIFPPQALIQPGQTQTFRVQYVGDPALTASRHYYVTVAELPVSLPAQRSQIQILYDFQVLVSIGPNGVKPALHVTSADIGQDAAGKPVPVITLVNSSATYGYLSQGALSIVERDSAGHEIFRKTEMGPELQQALGLGLIASGQSRRFVIPVALPAAGGTLEAKFSSSR